MGGNGRRVYAALQFRLNRPGPRSSSSACRNGHHVGMTDDEQRDGGVLAGLPASRPQRRSRRRGDEGSAGVATPAETGDAAATTSAPGAKPSSSAKPGTAKGAAPKGAGTATSA